MTEDVKILDLDFLSTIERIEKYPLASARQMKGSLTEATFRNADDSLTSRRNELIAFGVALARELRESGELMDEFLRDEHWKNDGHKPNPDKVLRLAMRYLLNAPSKGPLYDRACTYRNGTQDFLDQGLDARLIPEEIKEAGGIEELAERRRARKAAKGARPAPHVSSPGTSRSDPIPAPDGGRNEPHDEGAEAEGSGGSDSDLRSKSRRPHMPRFNSQKHILLDATQGQMEKLFRPQRPMRFALIVSAEGEEEDFVTLRLETIEPR